ncbi:MAG: polysaccharide deacetylase [Lachnospiraceae bacterium]|nr:polysaccharide deacetylase [Lachnospiraceae bacterium]
MEESKEKEAIKEVKSDDVSKRRKRVNAIKRIIIIMIIMGIIFPNLMCMYLFVKIERINSRLDAIDVAISEINDKFVVEEVQTEEPVYYSPEKLEELVIPVDNENIVSDSAIYEGRKRVYLTFDDGPSKYTDEILDILNEYNIKATFFVLAKDGYDDQYNRIVREGNTLAIHSYSHDYNTIYASEDSFREDVTAVADYVYNVTGLKVKFYRFPGGSSNRVSSVPTSSFINILKENNLVYYDWNVASGDAVSNPLSASQIYNNVINGCAGRDDCVVLMHDAVGKHSTVEALPSIIEKLQSEGAVFLPITEGTNQITHKIND